MKIMEDGVENGLMVVFLAGYKNEKKEEREFEWVKSTAKIGVHRLFVQPEACKWYHNCIDELIELIPKKAKRKKILIVGASMGGYAALLLSQVLGCESLTFSPQTSIESGVDERWEQLTSLARTITKHPEWLNLRKFVKGPHHHIYFGEVLGDIKQALGVEGATLYKVMHDQHNICGHLKTQGLLKRVLLRRIKLMEKET